MNIFTRFLQDERGFVLSAESVLLGTVGVIGASVGLGAVAESVNDELTEVAMAFRSLDQSYKVEGSSVVEPGSLVRSSPKPLSSSRSRNWLRKSTPPRQKPRRTRSPKR